MSQSDVTRRIDISAKISDYVYTYEQKYNDALNDGDPDTDPVKNGQASIDKKLANDKLRLIDATYDPSTGVAAIAVYDSQTDETYIAYAGTNFEADGLKDVESDAAIGLNDSLYLKKLGDRAVSFYDQVQRSGARITVMREMFRLD
ncbi:TPA: hypothetical protein U0K67_001227 [Streptococcus suis]|nr:hypothetical protein [Streptococcus suis]